MKSRKSILSGEKNKVDKKSRQELFKGLKARASAASNSRHTHPVIVYTWTMFYLAPAEFIVK